MSWHNQGVAISAAAISAAVVVVDVWLLPNLVERATRSLVVVVVVVVVVVWTVGGVFKRRPTALHFFYPILQALTRTINLTPQRGLLFQLLLLCLA